ncbi:hypothetical protein [Sphingomonas sp.]
MIWIIICMTLVMLPPRFDPAIRIKERQIKQGWHPECIRAGNGEKHGG